MDIKAQTDSYFRGLFLWLFLFVFALYMVVQPEADEGSLKYITLSLALYAVIHFLFSLKKTKDFLEEHEREETQEDITKEHFTPRPVTRRSLFHYLRYFPAEHPHGFLSVVGLLIADKYGNLGAEIRQVMDTIPILKHISPSLALIILILIFSDYAYHIQAKWVRRAVKGFVVLQLPFFLPFFCVGLLAPLFLVMDGLLTLSLQDMLQFLSSFENLIWLFIYPGAVLLASKYIFLKNQKWVPEA